MSEHTPTTNDVREAYVWDRWEADQQFRKHSLPEFAHWLAQVKAEARAEVAEEIEAARAEAESRYPQPTEGVEFEYPREALRFYQRGFVDGAQWADGRAETTTATPPTTATDEDAARRLYNALRRAWPEGYADPEDVEDWSYWEEIARDAGLLATARTRPTRQQLARAIDDVIGDVDLHDVTRAEMDQATEQAADAVLALLEGGGDE